MAFVINRSQLSSVFDTKNPNPGLGAYSIQHNKIQVYAAPFNSSSYKKSCFEIQQNKVGPGLYEQKCQLQSYKNRSKTVSSCFKSIVKRFDQDKPKNNENYIKKHQSQKNLSYSLNQKNNSNIKNKIKQKQQSLNDLRKKNKERMSKLQGKQTIRIVSVNPKNTQHVQSLYVDKNANIKYSNGPGQYQTQSSFTSKNTKSVINWANQPKRFKNKSLQNQKNPGPGQYEVNSQGIQKFNRKRLTSSFSYAGMRSFIDQIVHNTHNKMKAQVLKVGEIKTKSPGPGDYTPQKFGHESFYYGRQIMGSTAERFKIQKQKNSLPGPGQYKNLQYKYKYNGIIKQVRNKIFGKDNSLSGYPNDAVPLIQQIKLLQSSIQNQQQQFCPLKQRCQSKLGTFSLDKRFKNTQIKTQAQHINYHIENSNKKIIKTSSYIFKSKLPRQPYEKKEQVNTFYDVKNYNISNKNNKIKQKLQNLKKVQIQRPPFDSKVQRFKNKSKQILSNSLDEIDIDYNIEQSKNHYSNIMLNKSKYKYAFTSKTKRQVFNISKNPGPGSYNNQYSLEKKTFNSQYKR